MTPQASRYHPLLVALHWVLALLIGAALVDGYVAVAPVQNDDPRKLDALQIHMALGMLILALMLFRLVVRWLTAKPPPAVTDAALVDRATPAVHIGFYVLVIAMAATGFATALLAGLPEIVFARSGAPLPASFGMFPTRVVHGWIAVLLALLVVLHGGAVLRRGRGRRDRVIGRMFLGRR